MVFLLQIVKPVQAQGCGLKYRAFIQALRPQESGAQGGARGERALQAVGNADSALGGSASFISAP